MENVFEQALANSTSTDVVAQTGTETASTNSDIPELGAEYDLDLSDISDESEDETAQVSADDTVDTVENTVNTVENPTNQAFAQMRTQNKELSNKVEQLDALAKTLGLKDVDELIAKTKDAQIKQQAKEQNLPEAVVRELNEMREFREEIRQRDIQQAYQAKESTFVGNLNEFIANNKMSDTAVKQMSDNLVKDGFTNDYLMSLPKTALNRILSSYVGANTQKILERKDAIRNELPLNQASTKVSSDTVLKQIDDIARQFAGK